MRSSVVIGSDSCLELRRRLRNREMMVFDLKLPICFVVGVNNASDLLDGVVEGEDDHERRARLLHEGVQHFHRAREVGFRQIIVYL